MSTSCSVFHRNDTYYPSMLERIQTSMRSAEKAATGFEVEMAPGETFLFRVERIPPK